MAVTYSPFQTQVCFLETVGQSMPGNVYSQPNKEHFSSCDREISPITVTSEHDLNPGQVKERNDCHITRHNVTLVRGRHSLIVIIVVASR